MTASTMGRKLSGPAMLGAPQHLKPYLDCVHEAQLMMRGGELSKDGAAVTTWEQWTLFRSGREVGAVVINGLNLRHG